MRIIAGTAKGRPLAGPKHEGLRPTSDRTRQVLFDLLGQAFEGGEVLDLYCGTGALALEALSRGCSSALCVDSDPRALKLTQTNAAGLGFDAQVVTRKASLPRELSALPTGPRRLIFADPPYEGANPVLGLLLRWVAASGILALDGTLVIESSRHSDFDVPQAPSAIGNLRRTQDRAIGDTVLHLYTREA
jgi:16S rRNA (guanine966-N2)-methyltransferase